MASAAFEQFLTRSSFVLGMGKLAPALSDPCNTGVGRPMGNQLVGFMRTLLFHSATPPERRVEDRTVWSLEASSHDWVWGFTPPPKVMRTVVDSLID